jgi:LysR family transcriptional regulator (chromosome initiation inhibitor)
LETVLPDVSLDLRLFWHQWRLGPDGAAPSERVALLDRIGAALVAGAKASLDKPN